MIGCLQLPSDGVVSLVLDVEILVVGADVVVVGVSEIDAHAQL